MRTPSLALLILTLAAPAQAYDIAAHMRVTPEAGNDFRVEFAPRADLPEYWCAAGSHVTRTLRLSERTRVFRTTPEPRKQGQGIGFTLDQARSTGSTGFTIYGGAQDGGMSAGSAVRHCLDYDIKIFGDP